MILHGEIQGNHLNKLKVLTLCFHVESDVFPHGFLQLVPNIEELVVCDGSFKEIFCLQSPNVDDTTLLSQLKVLRLESLPELVSIGSLNLVPCTMSFSNLTKRMKQCSQNQSKSIQHYVVQLQINQTSITDTPLIAIRSYMRYLLSCFLESGNVSIIISPSSNVKWCVFSAMPLEAKDIYISVCAP